MISLNVNVIMSSNEPWRWEREWHQRCQKLLECSTAPPVTLVFIACLKLVKLFFIDQNPLRLPHKDAILLVLKIQAIFRFFKCGGVDDDDDGDDDSEPAEKLHFQEASVWQDYLPSLIYPMALWILYLASWRQTNFMANSLMKSLNIPSYLHHSDVATGW